MQLGGHLDFLFGLTRPNPLAPCISVRDLDAIGAILGLRPRASIISTSTLHSGDTSTSRLAARTLGQSDSLPPSDWARVEEKALWSSHQK